MRRNLTPDCLMKRRNNVQRKKKYNPISIINNNSSLQKQNFDIDIDYGELHKFQVNQSGKIFILSIQIKGNNIELNCIEDVPNSLVYMKKLSLESLRQISELFSVINTIQEAFTLIYEAIINQKIEIQITENNFNLHLYLEKQCQGLVDSKLNLFPQKINIKNNENFNKNKENYSKEKEIYDLRNEIKRITISLNEKNKRIDELENKVKKETELKGKYYNKIIHLENQLSSKDKELEILRDNIIKIENQLSQQDTELNEIKKYNQQYYDEKKYGEIISQKDNELKNLTEKNKQESQFLKNEIKNLKNIIDDNKQLNFILIKQKDQEIQSLKEEIKEIKNKNGPIQIKNGNMIELIFQSTDGIINNCKIKCFDEDIFAKAEEELYKIFPQYRKTNNYFIINGNIILRFQTIKENKINNGIPIIFIPAKDYANSEYKKNEKNNNLENTNMNSMILNGFNLKNYIGNSINNYIGNIINNIIMNSVNGGNNNINNNMNLGMNNNFENNYLKNM